MKVIDLTGKTFGRLTVQSRKIVKGARRAIWNCLCECGKTHTASGSDLTTGDIRSCGCLGKEMLVARNITHGLSKTPEYGIWQAMKNRCTNPTVSNYKNYGGRGIKVCDRWLNSFSAFYEDMGKRPSPAYSIERIDYDGNYEPGNCKWATALEQANNRCTNHRGFYRGEEVTIAELARRTGISPMTLYCRIVRAGKTFEEAAEYRTERYAFSGKELTLKEWAKELSIPYKVIFNRVKSRKWPLEKALSQPLRGKRD